MVLLQPNAFLDNPFATREDVQRGLLGLLAPLEAHTSPGGALISFGETSTHYDSRAVEFESFTRPLWGLAALLLGGGRYDGTERWVRGLAAGTDPASAEYWGASRAKDQRMVEMSPLSFAIALRPEVFYDTQTAETKENIAAFLNSCQSQPMPDTNWLWFRVFANLALRRINSGYFDAAQMARDLERLDSFQLPPHAPAGSDAGSAGWSRDGPEGVMQLDYYSSSFAIQFAQMVYAKLCADTDPTRAKSYIARAQSFVLDFVHYFSPSGEGIPFGRSMIYRFAIISTFSAMALCDIPPPPPLGWGHVKGLVLRHLRCWSRTRQIFNSDGTLNIGYHYAQFHMTENYNSPGSPYWCCKAFVCLGASASHPFWASEELPYPDVPRVRALPDPVHITVRAAGHTFLLSSGQMPHYGMRNGPAKYAKFAYSASFGFSCATGDMDLEHTAADSMLAVRDSSQCDGETWRVRRAPLNAALIGRGTNKIHLRSSWRPFPDTEIETWLLPPAGDEAYYLRVHRITTARALDTAEAGWATYGQGPDGRALVQAFSGETSAGGLAVVGAARACTAGGSVGVRDVQVGKKNGSHTAQLRTGTLVQSDPGSNVIFSRSVLPTLRGRVEAGTSWYATAVFGLPGERGEEEVDEAWGRVPEVPGWVLE